MRAGWSWRGCCWPTSTRTWPVATGLVGAHLRLATQILTLDMPEQQWDGLADGPSLDVTDRARLRHLYHHQKLPLHDIARLALTTERLVRRILAETGSPPQPSRPRRANISRNWFKQHYLNSGKSLQQLAADSGHSRNTLSKYAYQHSVPIGLPANPFATWPKSAMPPSAVVAACSGPRGIEYVQNILRMPGHPTRRAAAAAIGIHERVLCRQRQRIERASGIQIFQPGTPLTPTAAGAKFLQAAAEALHQPDQYRGNSS